ncbi:hypothetical protein [Geopseudomonas aromaticivorans]
MSPATGFTIQRDAMPAGAGMQVIQDFDRGAVIELAQACFDGKHLKVMPAAFYRQFGQKELTLFCLGSGLYCLPTFELLDVLNGLILEASPTRNVIEVGAGNGAIGRGLGILSTDSLQQNDPVFAQVYAAMGQPVVVYGDNVRALDANTAVEQLRPEVALGAWVTHRYEAERGDLGGNMSGIDEGDLLQRVRRYVVVGNHAIHGMKPIMSRVSRVIEGDYLFSRSLQHAHRNAIFVWDR